MHEFADLSSDEMMALRRIGFWRSDEEPDLPYPGDSVDPDWRAAEGERVVAYLERAYCIPVLQSGISWCRLGCSDGPADIGAQDHTDGTFLFPEGLAHYVRVHAVRPPEEFLEHVRANGYRVRRLPVLEA